MKQNQSLILGIAVAVVGGGALLAMLLRAAPGGSGTQVDARNGGAAASAPAAKPGVTMEDGRQIVTIAARGGYTPRVSNVQAGVPTTLRFVTKGSYDCSSVISIPKLGITQDLPATGTTDIDVGVIGPEGLDGSCGMGMFFFSLKAS